MVVVVCLNMLLDTYMSNSSEVVEDEVGFRRTFVAWEIKAYPHPTLPMDIGMAVLGFFFCGFLVCEGVFYSEESTRHVMSLTGWVGLAITIFFWITVVRQKTVYSYRFTESGCEVEYWLNLPKSGSVFFKGFAIFAFIAILSMISIDPSLIWIAAGPAGISIAAAVKLLNWENPVEHHATDWARYDLVFIDRKRKMVVPSFHADPLAGFEVHLEKARIDDFVAFLKTVIPHAEFREAEWKW
jgi:hypothetical protein